MARVLRPGGALAFTLRSYYTAYLETLWREFLRHGRRPRSWRNLDGADGVERDLRDIKVEVTALERAGFRLREISSVRFLPFLRRWIGPGYWHGRLATAFGSDVIFVAEKPSTAHQRIIVDEIEEDRVQEDPGHLGWRRIAANGRAIGLLGGRLIATSGT